MKFIPRNIHAILDYLVGALLIAAPWAFDFANDGPETWVPVIVGAGAIMYSLLTKYEGGLFRVIPFKTHLVLDFIAGAFLAASPWLFDFSEYVWIPHVAFGAMEMLAALTTRDSATTHSGDTIDGDVNHPQHTVGNRAVR